MLRQCTKSAGFSLSLAVPVLPYLGYQAGNSWLAPILFFLILPLLGKALGGDRTPPLNPRNARGLLRLYFRWLPRLYFPIWLFSLIWTATIITRPETGASTIVGLGFSAALGSATGSAISHELMHRKSAVDMWLARLMVSLMGYPHYIREHLYHHRHVGIIGQSLSAKVGESLWSFLIRILPEGRKAARESESRILVRQGKPFWRSGILFNSLLSIAWGMFFFWLAGPPGLALFVFQALFSVFSIQAINYIQHYGLARVPGEPIGHDLAWEDNCPIANCLTLNINHHSEHHLKPSRPFFTLALDEQSPRLPASYMIMLFIALVPALWRKVMDVRLIAYLKSREHSPFQRDGECLDVLGELIR